MPKIFHRKSRMSNLENVVHPQNIIEETQEAIQNISDNIQDRIPDDKKKCKSKTIKELRSFAIVKETKRCMDDCAITRVIIANTEPMMIKIIKSKPVEFVSPVTKFVDKISYKSLKFTEKLFPSIKDKSLKKMKLKIVKKIKKGDHKKNKMIKDGMKKGDKYIYEPTHSKILKFRKYYNEKVYDTKGKPLIRGAFDPVILPFNNAFENTTHKYFPDGKPVTGKFSCEFDRTFALTIRMSKNMNPIIKCKTKNMMMKPFKYKKHVNKVINKHLDMEKNLCFKNSIHAIKGAMKELYKELWKDIKKNPPMKYFVKKRFNDHVEEIVDNTVNTVESIPAQIVRGVNNAEATVVNAVQENVPSPHEIRINIV